jgi:hypothetical protein
MLDPNARSLLVDSLRPPAGYAFSVGLATTYTLDLTTLLSVPLHLALLSAGNRKEMLQDGVALLEAVRRTTDKLAIFCQQGRIGAPNLPHVLYGLLEPCVVEVNAPNGGVFHPKLWMLRFENQSDRNDVVLRLLVLSRNLSNDRSWDLSLSVDGVPGKRAVTQNRSLADLMSSLPDLGAVAPSGRIREHCSLVADEMRRTPWELPGKFESLAFHAIGLTKKSWMPKPSKRLAVISPFVSVHALDSLAATSQQPVALISRPDELARIPKASLDRFGAIKVLHESAETEDGDDGVAVEHLARGLHAKAYITEDGWKTTLYLGSANATAPALLSGANVEILAELTGYKSAVGGIDALLGDDGLQEYLIDFVPPAEPPPPSLEEQAEDIIDSVRSALTRAKMQLTCCPAGDDVWDLKLASRARIDLGQIASIRLWPISLVQERAVDATSLATAGAVVVPRCATASITGFIAFELVSTLCSHTACFVLNVPVENMPASREAAVLRTIIANREGFLRYLMLLLQDFDSAASMSELAAAIGGVWNSAASGLDALPLLEELTRAYCRNPNRLRSVRTLVEQLGGTAQGREVIPPEFMALWKTFDSLLPEAEE